MTAATKTRLTTPTRELVTAACKEFDKDSSGAEEAPRELFSQYPANHDLRHVLLKVVALNSLYSTQIFVHSAKVPNIEDAARHIHQHAEEVDLALAAGSPGIVDGIARVTIPGKMNRNYFLVCDQVLQLAQTRVVPIWDSNVERYLGRLQRETGFFKAFNINVSRGNERIPGCLPSWLVLLQGH